jgi:hypothetical protein
MKDYAGGIFGLKKEIIKLYNLAEKNTNENEVLNAKMALIRRGYFLDFVGILWDVNKIPDIVKENDKNYKILIENKLTIKK